MELPPILSDTAIRNAKPGERPVQLFDKRGLYLELSPTWAQVVAAQVSVRRKEKRLSMTVETLLKRSVNRGGKPPIAPGSPFRVWTRSRIAPRGVPFVRAC